MKGNFKLAQINVQVLRKGRFVYSFVLLAIAILVMPLLSSGQQYVKTYNSLPSCNGDAGNLMFGCIVKSNTVGQYYIAGTQDTSIYLSEVNAMGAILQEKLIGVRNATTVLRSMIVDEDGNIVIVGSTYNGLGYTAFLLKVSPALSVLLHRDYNLNVTSTRKSTAFTDIKDHKYSNTYYISGVIANTSVGNSGDALLLRVDRTTGNIVNKITDNAGYIDNYDALVFSPKSTNVIPKVIATGVFSTNSLSTFRPQINIHNNTLTFLKGRSYIQDLTSPGRLYSSSLINDGDSLLNCWTGDVTSSLKYGKNVGFSKCDAALLMPGWQKEYLITPVPAKQPAKWFNKVASDPNGYVVEGNWWDNVTRINLGVVGEMMLLRTTKNGIPVWSRKIKDVLINNGNHNSSFVIDGKSIFAVGFRAAAPGSLNHTGVLVRIPLLDGALDTTCSVVQDVTVKDYKFSVADQLTDIPITLKDTVIYYPINCTKTDPTTACDQCNPFVQLPSADFTLSGTIPSGNTTTFQVTASGFATTDNSRWTVSEVIFGFDYMLFSSLANGIWGTAASTQFGGWLGSLTVSENNTGVGVFVQNHSYRFRHILSQTTNCGITKNDTVVKTISMCTTCRGANKGKIIVETETANSARSTLETSKAALPNNNVGLKLMPNPVSGSSFVLEYFTANKTNVSVKIADVNGREMVNKTFSTNAGRVNRFTMETNQLANGAYIVVVSNEGKITTQTFIVAK